MNIIKKTFLLFSALLLVVNALSFSQDNTESGEQGKKDEEKALASAFATGVCPVAWRMRFDRKSAVGRFRNASA